MIKRRGFKALAAFAAAAFLLVGCSSTDGGGSDTSSSDSTGGSGGGDVTIGATFPILDQFLQTVADAMQSKADELGVTLNVVAADEQTDTQLGQVENFIAQGVDAILVIPVDTDAAGPMTQAAQDAGVPLVYVNRKPSDLPAGVPYVGSDSLYAGTVEMQALAEMAGGEGNVVILIGDPANEAAVQRTQGCKDVVDENPGMTVTKEQAGNWYREEGQNIMENWIQSGDDIKVVCANNDEMALGAINAIKAAGISLGADGILVGGVDATSDALASMEAGELSVTVFQDAAGQGAGGVDAAMTLIGGGIVDDYVDIPYQLVTPDNMADFQ
ncbi:sugar ABC transporter substrate-binding protein [Actinotalea sp. M2MS4P-6]|uniref:sugar ABC transporter substrate-binding protein n=1 Tax=Actinotalea sp. M2MS4P-6 TaxID=2983762 RepID=UPI0021E48573|nr:sugar ABC transporter substrate-binding protein [Actinotalea sp. M2MS4P-6]MCV2395029.1 sugar ABC transporter substrate-binding protein [Actinotalea sp. M2MS4P-6]